MLKIVCVCGARPNFMKVAPILDVLRQRDDVETVLVHTGQHYDHGMSQQFFEELRIARPDFELGVGSGSHAAQTASVMARFEAVCFQQRPDWVVVVGDVNSTMACALVASKMGIKVAHVEAGLRSFDRSMPEEINRIVTDAVSEMLFATEPSAVSNLRREGVAEQRVHLVGNVMIDTLLKSRPLAEQSTILSTFDVTPNAYAVLTLHRPSNVDDHEAFAAILDAIEVIAAEQPVVFPIHPRSRGKLATLNLEGRANAMANLHVVEPLGYFDFLKLIGNASVVLTDSGGIQEELTILGVPCLTLRRNTERPVTISEGTNLLAGCSTESIVAAYRAIRDNPPLPGTMPALWDGHAAERIVAELLKPETVRAKTSDVVTAPIGTVKERRPAPTSIQAGAKA